MPPFTINITDEQIQMIHNAANRLADFQGPPGINPPPDVGMLGLPNIAGAYEFGINQKAELLRILNAELELLELDLMVVFNAGGGDEVQEKQAKVTNLIQEIEAAQDLQNNNVNMARGGRRRKHKSRKARKSRKSRKSKKSRRTKH